MDKAVESVFEDAGNQPPRPIQIFRPEQSQRIRDLWYLYADLLRDMTTRAACIERETAGQVMDSSAVAIVRTTLEQTNKEILQFYAEFSVPAVVPKLATKAMETIYLKFVELVEVLKSIQLSLRVAKGEQVPKNGRDFLGAKERSQWNVPTDPAKRDEYFAVFTLRLRATGGENFQTMKIVPLKVEKGIAKKLGELFEGVRDLSKQIAPIGLVTPEYFYQLVARFTVHAVNEMQGKLPLVDEGQKKNYADSIRAAQSLEQYGRTQMQNFVKLYTR